MNGSMGYLCCAWLACVGKGLVYTCRVGFTNCSGQREAGAPACLLTPPAHAPQQADGHLVYEFEAACHLGAKLAGVHWWFKSRAHAAELTAGYYNTRERDGYADVMAMLRRHRARLSFTCVEMRDCEHPPEGRCSPQGAHRWTGSTCQSTSSAAAGGSCCCFTAVKQQCEMPCA